MERITEIPFKSYRDGIFERLGELSRVSNLSKGEMAEYNANLKWARDYHARMDYARSEGEAKGRAEGTMQVARNMKAAGYGVQEISGLTGLSAEEISKL